MRRLALVLMWFAAAACGSGSPAPSQPGGGGSTTETITGRERIGWNQQADDVGELSSFRYAVYVDGVRSELGGTSCSTSAASAGYECSGRLPPMAPGTHTLEIATYVVVDGVTVESGRSVPLRVTVTASTAPAGEPWAGGETETTGDGVALRADRLSDGLDQPVDAAFASDGRLFIAERRGRIRTVVDGEIQSSDALQLVASNRDAFPPEILSVTIAPDFDRTHFVYVLQTARGGAGGIVQLARYREVGGALGERAVLFETKLPPDVETSAVVRFGPDGKLYAALGGEGGNGRLLRLNAEGGVPRDQAGSGPEVATGIESARGLDWQPGAATMWIADDDGAEGHLSAVRMSVPPVRAIVEARRAVRGAVHALAFYKGDALPAFRRDALLASAEGYIIRLRFAEDDPTRVASSERLLDQRAGPIRVVLVSPAGEIYFCTDTTLGKLAPPRE